VDAPVTTTNKTSVFFFIPGVDGRIILKQNFREWDVGCGLD
jgi:hypothetical protein